MKKDPCLTFGNIQADLTQRGDLVIRQLERTGSNYNGGNQRIEPTKSITLTNEERAKLAGFLKE